MMKFSCKNMYYLFFFTKKNNTLKKSRQIFSSKAPKMIEPTLSLCVNILLVCCNLHGTALYHMVKISNMKARHIVFYI